MNGSLGDGLLAHDGANAASGEEVGGARGERRGHVSVQRRVRRIKRIEPTQKAEKATRHS
jgi:hypothetical protein